MSTNVKSRASWVLTLTIATAAVLTAVLLQPARAEKEGGASAGKYSVIATEGHNLIVTDNSTNTLYFYTIDKDKTIGSELKLRGSIDLTQVGKPEIKPTTHKLADHWNEEQDERRSAGYLRWLVWLAMHHERQASEA